MADKEKIPLGQKLVDSPFLLLIVGNVIMLITYSAWGVIELLTLPQSPLP